MDKLDIPSKGEDDTEKRANEEDEKLSSSDDVGEIGKQGT
jgi:hypothetical protein